MTEESYQQGRKFMQQVNHIRGLITASKGEVAKWSNIEHSFKESMQEAKANGARKMLEKAMATLEERQKKFESMKFPESNIVKISNRCKDCKSKIPDNKKYCGGDLCINESF